MPAPLTMVTVSDLLARPDVDGDQCIPPGLLADLNHPHLVITDEYVGPDRGRSARHDRRSAPRVARRRAVRPVVVAVVVTAAVVAPLTLALSHPAVPAPAAPPVAHRTAGPLTGH